MSKVSEMTDLPAHLKCLLYEFANCYNDKTGQLNPSHKYLARRCGNVSERTIRRQCENLKSLGLLIVTDSRTAERRSKRYAFSFYPLDESGLHVPPKVDINTGHE